MKHLIKGISVVMVIASMYLIYKLMYLDEKLNKIDILVMLSTLVWSFIKLYITKIQKVNDR